jgi:predicted small integral membrane protein
MKRSFFTAVFTIALGLALLVSTNQPAQGFTKGKTIQIYFVGFLNISRVSQKTLL